MCRSRPVVRRTWSFRSRAATRVCNVDFEVTPTAVPAIVTKGSIRTSELGAHFSTFEYKPAK